MYGLSNMDFHSSRPIWLEPLLSSQPAKSKYQHRAPKEAPFPEGTSQPPGISSLYWITSIIEGAAFCSHWKRHIYAGYGFAFPTLNVSAKTTICGLTECHIHPHSIPYDIASDKKKTILWQMKCNIGLMLMDFSGIIMFPSSWNSWPNKIMEWPLKDCYGTSWWQHFMGLK